jgi:hypothetical protein
MIDLYKVAEQALARKAGEYAPGIPVKGVKRDIPTIKDGREWVFSEQIHEAARAGKHSDLRLSDGNTAYSWAVRKGIPGPGQSVLAVRTNDHTTDYMGFSGTIGAGYGMGKVTLNRLGPIKVLSSSPETIKWAALDKKNPQEFLMFRLPASKTDGWILKNVTPTVDSRKDVPIGKPRFGKSEVDAMDRFMTDRYLLSSKIDGAHLTVGFKARPEVFSHQPSVTGDLVNHTYVFGLDSAKVPEELKDTRIRAEGFAMKDGKVIPNKDLAGLLNASPGKSLQRIKDEGIQMVLAPLKVLEHQGRSVETLPYKDHLALMKDIIKRAPGTWMLPDMAMTPEQKRKMVDAIKAGKHPLTSEGVVAWPLNEAAAAPVKIPFRGHHQVYIDEIFPMKSDGKEMPLAGGFWYRLTPKGPRVGKVGTGFDDATRKDMWESRSDLVGRKAVVDALQQFPGGAFRAPSFVSLHL